MKSSFAKNFFFFQKLRFLLHIPGNINQTELFWLSNNNLNLG